MDPLTLTVAALKAKALFGKLLKSKWLYIILAVIAIGGGTYAYLNHSTNQAVASAVANSDAKATIDTYKTRDQAEAALIPLNEKAEAKAEQTRKDYQHVRQQVYSHSAPERSQIAPPLIIDTLNDLERMSRSREDTDGVSDAEVRPN